jgi:CelD/BcsL family acetyltransferase involved in cellulose biosynthesis
MQVREIDTIAEFERLRGDWSAAFAADAHASVFMSWDWLRGWFDVTPHPWTVLAARERDRGPWLGFLPISLRGSRSALRVDHLREVHMAGEPAADYTGFVCRSDAEASVIRALAQYVANDLPWDKLRFEEVRDPRMAAFLACMPGNMHVLEHQGTPCPGMPLPATWEELMQSLSRSTRQSLRKRMRVAEKEFRVTRFDGRDDEAMIDALIQMAIARTRDDPDPHTWRLHGPLRRCAAAGIGRMVMLWRGRTPAAAVASLIDARTSSNGLWVTSFDERFAELSPGRVAVAIAIRDAIEAGLRHFDFMRGEEPYKFQFGAVSAHNRTLNMERPTFQAALRRGISGVRESLRI